MVPAPMIKNLKREKPWAKLRMTRRSYEAARPWAKSGMDRQQFENIMLAIPDEAIDAIKLEADAERLVDAMFGQAGE